MFKLEKLERPRPSGGSGAGNKNDPESVWRCVRNLLRLKVTQLATREGVPLISHNDTISRLTLVALVFQFTYKHLLIYS